MKRLKEAAYQTLRKSEFFLKMDMIYAAKGGFWTTLSFVIGMLGSLVTMVAFGNLLSRETYGVYTYLISLGSSLAFLTLSGAGPAVIRAVARGVENIVPVALRMQLKYNLLAVGIVGAAALYYSYKGNQIFGLSLALLAVAYPLGEAFHIYSQVLIGKQRFDILTRITTSITFIGAIFTVIALFFTDNVAILVAVFAFISLVPKILAYHWTTRRLDRSEASKEDIGELRRTSFHITGAGIAGTIASYIDKIALFQIAGPSALAVYGFAIAGPERLKSLTKNWTSIALPRLAERSISEIRNVFYKRLGLSLLMGTVLAGVYILFSPFLFKLLLPNYLDSIIFSQVYALGLIFIPILVYIGNIFYSQNMIRAIYITSIGIQVLRIVIFVLFAWLWGIWGLVTGAVLYQIMSVFFCTYIWEKESKRLLGIQNEI